MFRWLACIFRRHTPGDIMADLKALDAITAKIAADIDTKLAADKAALDAKDATDLLEQKMLAAEADPPLTIAELVGML